MTYQHITCAIDFSEHSREAMRMAMTLAGPDTRVTLLHIFDVPFLALPDMPMDPSILEAALRSAQKQLREWAGEAAKMGPGRVEAVCQQGFAWDAIVNVAAQRRADLVVIGTHGRTGIKHALIGSVAERVVRHAACPVLVVRAVGAR